MFCKLYKNILLISVMNVSFSTKFNMRIMVYCLYFTDVIFDINFKINVHICFSILSFNFCKIELIVLRI